MFWSEYNANKMKRAIGISIKYIYPRQNSKSHLSLSDLLKQEIGIVIPGWL